MSGGWQDRWRTVLPEDVEAVSRLLSAGTLSVPAGGLLDEFEERFAAFAGTGRAVATPNGTTALYAALWAVGVRAGDDVLVCDYGFHAMAAAVLALGARVVPCDCDPETLTLDPREIPRRRTARTRAVLVHNPWGVPADWAGLRRHADGLPLVADASHAQGARYRDRPLAAWCDVAAYSLGLGKLITGGELGCAATDDPRLRDRMLLLGHVNRVPGALAVDPWRGNAVGLKLRPHPVAMTLAAAQLERYDARLARLRRTSEALERALAPAGLRPQGVPEGGERVWWRLVLHLDPDRYDGVATATVETALRAAGLPVEDNHYWPLLQEQELFRWPDHRDGVLHQPCPVAAARVPRTITLPAPTELPADEIAAAGRAAGRALAGLGRRRSAGTAG